MFKCGGCANNFYRSFSDSSLSKAQEMVRFAQLNFMDTDFVDSSRHSREKFISVWMTLREQVATLIHSPQLANDSNWMKNILSAAIQSFNFLSPPWHVEQPFVLDLPRRHLLMATIFHHLLKRALVQHHKNRETFADMLLASASIKDNLVVLGPRRVGKTSLFQIMSLFGSLAFGDRISPLFIEYSRGNIVTPHQILNFVTGVESATLRDALEVWTSRYGPPILFFDNFQLLFEENISVCVQMKRELDILCQHSEALIYLTGGMGPRLERLLFKEPLQQHSSFLTEERFQKFSLSPPETFQDWQVYCSQINPGICAVSSLSM